ncbi:MAG TPA: hypothetical protein VFB52_04735, partial [Solirubrobacterales bacterium]|nr:hypothetical protein [Solirubrobacterales bacterium]
VYEGVGSAPAGLLADGAEIVRTAGRTWRIPVVVAEADPEDPETWAEEMRKAALGAISGAG